MMYTFKVSCANNDDYFGPVCHNYATACFHATNYMDDIVKNGAKVVGNMENILHPYDIVFKIDGIMKRLVVGKLEFNQL